MYPIQCYAGFPVPICAGAGKFEIAGFSATVKTPTESSQIAFFDDSGVHNGDSFGRLIPIADIYTTKTLLIDIKGVASVDAQLSYEFSESVKTRHGISVASDNIKGGSICLYRR